MTYEYYDWTPTYIVVFLVFFTYEIRRPIPIIIATIPLYVYYCLILFQDYRFFDIYGYVYLTLATLTNIKCIYTAFSQNRIAYHWLNARLLVRFLPLFLSVPVYANRSAYTFTLHATIIIYFTVLILFDSHRFISDRDSRYSTPIWVAHFVSIIFSIALCIVNYASIYAIVGTKIGANKDGSDIITNSFLDGLYLSVVTWTTLGYGDVTLVGTTGRIFAAFEAISGNLTMALVISLLIALFSLFSNVSQKNVSPISRYEDKVIEDAGISDIKKKS